MRTNADAITSLPTAIWTADAAGSDVACGVRESLGTCGARVVGREVALAHPERVASDGSLDADAASPVRALVDEPVAMLTRRKLGVAGPEPQHRGCAEPAGTEAA